MERRRSVVQQSISCGRLLTLPLHRPGGAPGGLLSAPMHGNAVGVPGHRSGSKHKVRVLSTRDTARQYIADFGRQ
ncbi:hypothetical protein FKP32DRAFT_1590410 [Trametes sanguinea]|nr:hypothetical protein FKP32DRAFT_1590410 [Trametes sanguinea]